MNTRAGEAPTRIFQAAPGFGGRVDTAGLACIGCLDYNGNASAGFGKRIV